MKEAIEQVKSLNGAGFFKRLLTNKHDDRRLEELGEKIIDTVKALSTDAIFTISADKSGTQFGSDSYAEELRKRYTKWVMERTMSTDIQVLSAYFLFLLHTFPFWMI